MPLMSDNVLPNIFMDYSERFFFLYGLLEDEFYTATLTPLNFEQVLHRYLQQLGYKRVLFYNKRKHLYFLDKISGDLLHSSSSVAQNSSPSAKKVSKISAGPLGRKQLVATNEEPISTQENKLSGINDGELVNNFSTWMHDSTIKTAFIFSDLLEFIQHIDDKSIVDMSNVLKECAALFSDNENLCLFLIPVRAENLGSILEDIVKRHPEWYFLRDRMFTSQHLLTKQMIAITTPREDEIYYACHAQRLKRDLPIDWSLFERGVVQVSRYSRGDGRSLKQINVDLQKIKQFDAATFADLSGNAEQSPALDRLSQMHGPENVKIRIKEMVEGFKDELANGPITQVMPENILSTVGRLLPYPNSPAKGLNLHLVLQGSPGTGKTTIAELIGEIYRDAGLLPSGHIVKVGKKDLVAEHVGGTAILTSQKIAEAMGGVLFVDEAYGLTENEGNIKFGSEAAETILEAMSNHLGEFSVIVAGYPNRMKAFIESNPGFRSRFSKTNTLTIEDYSPLTLHNIFIEYVAQKKRHIAPELQEQLLTFFTNLHAERNEETFGNARDIINIYYAIDNMRQTRVREQNFTDKERFTLIIADVPKLYSNCLGVRSGDSGGEQALEKLIGLASVKQTVRDIVASLKMGKLRGGTNNIVPGHYLFVGNSGTGKTTVARLMGEIFKQLGLLKKGDLIETKTVDLLSDHVGGTAQKTQVVLERSLDNVLFIDEAHQLIMDNEKYNYGKEAIATLIAFMENHRDRLCIIAAGYPEGMEKFVNSDPGLPSRFSTTVKFENYSALEFLIIFKQMMTEKSLILGSNVESELLEIFRSWECNSDPTFANGRAVRNLLDNVRKCMDRRLSNEHNLTPKDARLYLIESVDLQAALLI